MNTDPEPAAPNPAAPASKPATPASRPAHGAMPLPPSHAGSKFFFGGGKPGKGGPVQPRPFGGRGFGGRTSHDHNRGRSH